MSPVTRAVALGGALLAGIPLLGFRSSTASAQAPTLPSDTLEANFAPPSALAPNPELAPSLPTDTIRVGAPLEGYEPNVPDSLNPGPAAGDSTAETPSQY
jgi:hypothetical protein